MSISNSKISASLSASFVKWEEVASVLTLAHAMRKPVLLYGRGGHGKSEMVRATFSALTKDPEEVGIQSCGEGMTEAALYGGLNLKALNCAENPRMEYYPERSFLSKRFFLFEELFDAPAVVLLSLKDTLMSRCLNNGAQTYKMRTELLVAATNKDPEEIAQMGCTFQALTERFPLQLRVEWESYNQEDFEEMLLKVEKQKKEGGISVPPQIISLLSGMIAEAHAKGEWISPRQAVTCLDAVRATAKLNDRYEAVEEDIMGIRYIPGTEGILEDLSSNLDRIRQEAAANASLKEVTEEVAAIAAVIQDSKKPIALLQQAKHLLEWEGILKDIRVPDSMTKAKKAIRDQISSLISEAQAKAMDVTMV